MPVYNETEPAEPDDSWLLAVRLMGRMGLIHEREIQERDDLIRQQKETAVLLVKYIDQMKEICQCGRLPAQIGRASCRERV